MKRSCLWLIPFLLSQSFGLEGDILPRKHNTVSGYLNKKLDSLYTQLTTSKLSIPEINLGNEIGKFTDVEIGVAGKAEKLVDGVKSWGFDLKTNLTKVVITGYYDVLNLDIPGLFPVFGKGKFRITLDVVKLNMKLTAFFSAVDDKFNIVIPDFQVLLENSTVNFENLMNDPHLSNFLNELLTKLLPDIAELMSRPFIEMSTPFIDYYGNGIIKCIKNGVLTGTTEKCIKDLFLTRPEGVMGLRIDLSKYANFQQ